MISELPVLEDFSKDDILDKEGDASHPHPFYILEQKSVACFFEPVLSVQKMGVIGLETVRLAVDPFDPSRLIKPRDLFQNMTAEDSHLRLPLDRLLWQKSLEAFFPLQVKAPHLLMFLDVEPSVLEESTVGSYHLMIQVRNMELDPRRIVVQLSLAEQVNPWPIQRFVEFQRGFGFLTSLKDVSSHPHHLDFLSRVNPDMVKVEDKLVRGLAGSREKQADFLGFLKKAHSLGILVTAGGIESEEDALVALEFGTDLVQGKYFSKNYKKGPVFILNRKSRMEFLASRFKRRLQGRADRDRDLKKRCDAVAASLAACLSKNPAGDWAGDLLALSRSFPQLECLYLLNAEGVQVTETVCSQHHIPERKCILFQPSPRGTDHSLREFYHALHSAPAQRRYLTEPYLSMSSGNLCVTAAIAVGDPSGDFPILCADLNVAKV